MHKQLQPVHLFLLHFAKNLVIGTLFIIGGLGIGMWGYHYYEHMPWVDAFCNAAMILSGMGPVVPLNTYGGKMFAGFYALFSGLTFIAIMGFVFAPVFKRFFHSMHLDE
jgi:hypothetical protein